MRGQAGNQVGQHGGTNRGLGGGEGERRGTFTLGNHPHQGGGRMSQGKRDTWGLKESSLVVFARFPQLSALEIPGWGHEVAYMRIISENSTPSQSLATFHIWSRQEGEGFSTGVVL